MKRLFPRLLEAALGALFVWAGILKAADPSAFATDIENYRLLSPLLSGLLACTLPCLEISCGAALLLGFWRQAARLLLLLCTTLFCAALASAWFRGLDIRCGCFGSQSDGIPLALARALGLFITLAWLHFHHRRLARQESAN